MKKATILSGLLALTLMMPAFAGEHKDHHPAGLPHPAHNDKATTKALLDTALAAPDRGSWQKDRDAARHTEFEFYAAHILPSYSVLDLGTGGGTVAMIASSIVGEKGHVDMQNPTIWVSKYDLKGAMDYVVAKRANVSALVVDFDQITVPARPYDVVVSSMIYHDTADLGVDRLKMNKATLAAMKPGAIYIIVDHRAEKGSGVRDVSTLHRIDPQTVIDDLTAAGFVFLHDHDLLANPNDTHTLNVFDPAIRGQTDRSVLVFQKPM